MHDARLIEWCVLELRFPTCGPRSGGTFAWWSASKPQKDRKKFYGWNEIV